jgi:ABC-type uncharacterized transport system involved in gliding motility auxiliary subunit
LPGWPAVAAEALPRIVARLVTLEIEFATLAEV